MWNFTNHGAGFGTPSRAYDESCPYNCSESACDCQYQLFHRRIDANGVAIPIFVPDGSQAFVIGQNVVSVLSYAAGGLFIDSIVHSGFQGED
jgi:hypothetical protein